MIKENRPSDKNRLILTKYLWFVLCVDPSAVKQMKEQIDQQTGVSFVVFGFRKIDLSTNDRTRCRLLLRDEAEIKKTS